MGKMKRAEKTRVEKAKAKKAPKMEVISESGVTTTEESLVPASRGEPLQTDTDLSAETAMAEQDARLAKSSIIDDGLATDRDAMVAMQNPEPQALTLPLLTDNATLFLQGAAQLVADTLGKPECAPLLVRLNDWIDGLTKLKKLIVGNDDAVEGLKAKVIADGEPWGENGSRQLVLAGAQVRVKAVNWRPVDKALTIDDLDAGKVEAYLRGAAAEPEKTLPSYMRGTMTWGLKDLSPLQQKNLTAMLADPGEWGQGLRQCVKDTKWQMMAPEMVMES